MLGANQKRATDLMIMRYIMRSLALRQVIVVAGYVCKQKHGGLVPIAGPLPF